MGKIAVVTTFADREWGSHARKMVKSFCEHWPEDVILMVQLDEGQNISEPSKIVYELNHYFRKEEPESADSEEVMNKDCVSFIFSDAQKEFLKRHENKFSQPVQDYRLDYIKFSYKVFAIYNALQFIKNQKEEYDYLIWLDSDIITNKKVTEEDIRKWCPADSFVSYLGRKDWDHSECGFVAYNVANGADKFIERFHEYYTTDKVLTLKQWHDSFVFDNVLAEGGFNGRKTTNLSEGIPGRDVFDSSPLAEFMTHYKGSRKLELSRPGAEIKQKPSYNIDEIKIRTQNCLDAQSIHNNIRRNLELINNWLPVCRNNGEPLIICSAGPSLDVEEIRPWYNAGVKIVSVKHALDSLLKAKIVPWSCVLLDPRQHVAGFVENPHPDVNYFISSMVDPQVTENLLKHTDKVYGYHAAVGTGEQAIIPDDHMMIYGGSATATRGISLMETLGFREMHCHGYDCSYAVKPDLKEIKENGKLKYIEQTLEVLSYGARPVHRTFWTEGQFLAQVQEFKKMYALRKGIKLYTYGDGIIPWVHKHMKKYKEWEKENDKKQDELYANGVNINKYLRGRNERAWKFGRKAK